MAFIVPELNYTQIPNALFDEWIPKLKEGELRVLLVIMRQTFGWQNKTWDYISTTQLMKKTGMQKMACLRSAKLLVQKGLLTKEVRGPSGKQETWYTLQVENSEKTQKSIEDSNNLYRYPKDTPPSILRIPTKETLTKEKKEISEDISKESAPPPPPPPKDKKKYSEKAYELAKLHREEVKAICPKSPEPYLELEAKSIEIMLTKDKRTEQEIRAVIDFVFHSKDDFWYKNTLKTSKLKKYFDRLWLEMQSKSQGKNQWNRKCQTGSINSKQDSLVKDLQERPLPPPGLIMKMLQE